MPLPIYFRADDIGVPSKSFSNLTHLFTKHNIPLCLAIVPAWLTKTRWSTIEASCDVSSPLWCWHQHGWNHINPSAFGEKKASSVLIVQLLQYAKIWSTAKKGYQTIIGPLFSPFFTPPWNRCSDTTLALLKDIGFKAVSRDLGSKQEEQQIIPDIFVNVDLHTRKELDSQACLAGLSREFEQACRTGTLGIMIHHQRMNANAFKILDDFLAAVRRNPFLKPRHFGTLF